MKIAQFAAVLGAGVVAGCGEAPRWYTPEQVALGRAVYAPRCAACHGDRAEGTSDWQRLTPEGVFPPPPLNGTGHAWHHSVDVLARVIREGSAGSGGTMPAFGDDLSEEEARAVIAFFQSLWPDRLYRQWLDNLGPVAP